MNFEEIVISFLLKMVRQYSQERLKARGVGKRHSNDIFCLYCLWYLLSRSN